ncbi:MAG: hypothetical protein AB8I58_24105 [Anaerolineales bacterium]
MEKKPAEYKDSFLGAFPFLLFGLAYLLEGIAELGGHYVPAFNLQDGSFLDRPLNHPAIMLTAPIAVYFLIALGLLFGMLKGFPRWSYAYLGMSIYFGWYYSNGRYYGVVYGLWAWLPILAAMILGLLLRRSLRPLAGLLQGVWNDWTRLSFALYTFLLPMTTVFFFDDDWGALQLYGLFIDTLLLAAGALVFLRARTSWGRVLSLEAAILTLLVKGILMAWLDGLGGPALNWMTMMIISSYFAFPLLPALIGLLRWGLNALASR